MQVWWGRRMTAASNGACDTWRTRCGSRRLSRAHRSKCARWTGCHCGAMAGQRTPNGSPREGKRMVLVARSCVVAVVSLRALLLEGDCNLACPSRHCQPRLKAVALAYCGLDRCCSRSHRTGVMCIARRSLASNAASRCTVRMIDST